ncbi:MAG: hypothetical protein PUE79_03245 [Bacteroidales bacterium]|nr:hypothetical protein [Bacteroidales bacterium]
MKELQNETTTPTPCRGSLHTALRKAKRHVGVSRSTDVSPCRGKSVKRDYFKQQELQSILPRNAFNQTMFNQFLVLLDD